MSPPARRFDSLLASGLGLLFLAISSGFAIAQHLTFHTRARDMGIYVQILWNAAQGRPFLSSLLQDNTNHLAEHVAPSLWPLVPLAGLAPDAVPLLVLQQAFLAACGWPIWLLARARLSRWPALALLLGFYLMPAISRVSLSEFHPVVLAALPVAGGVASALLGRPRAAALLLLFGLLFEEEVAPTVVGGAGLLLVLGLRRRFWKPPLLLAAAATVYLALVILVVMPGFRVRAARGETANRTAGHFDLVRQDPGLVGGWLTTERGPDALAWLVLPTGGLALLAPTVLAVDLPSFVVLFLQDRAGTYAGHWSSPLLPVVWLAASVGLARLGRFAPGGLLGLGLLGCGTALAYGLDGYFPGGREFAADHYATTDLETDLRRAVDLVPADASLAGTRRVVPHLAARRDLYQFPFSFYGAPLRPDSQRLDYYLLDLTDSPTRREVDVGESDSVLEKRPRYQIRRFGPSVLLLSKSRPEPSEARSESFGGALRLLGLDGPAADGGGVAVQLYWEATRRPESEPTRVLRLIGPDGRELATLTGRPLDDFLPVRDWERGQVVVERLVLEPAAPLAAGSYRLLVGWRGADGRPLSLDQGGVAELELARFEQR